MLLLIFLSTWMWEELDFQDWMACRLLHVNWGIELCHHVLCIFLIVEVASRLIRPSTRDIQQDTDIDDIVHVFGLWSTREQFLGSVWSELFFLKSVWQQATQSFLLVYDPIGVWTTNYLLLLASSSFLLAANWKLACSWRRSKPRNRLKKKRTNVPAATIVTLLLPKNVDKWTPWDKFPCFWSRFMYYIYLWLSPSSLNGKAYLSSGNQNCLQQSNIIKYGWSLISSTQRFFPCFVEKPLQEFHQGKTKHKKE